MAKNSQIQWTDHTWNIAVGCTKVDADCKYCYMYRDASRYGYDAKVVRKTKSVFRLPLRIKEPSKIFVSSLTDVFHPDCDSFRDEMWDIIRQCPQHTFQILTKRPERIADHLPPDWGTGWENVWLGTSVGSMSGMSRALDLIKLRGISKVLFLSMEPLHERVTFAWQYVCTDESDGDFKGPMVKDVHKFDLLLNIDWVIVGGESGNENGKYRYRPCEFEWMENIVLSCEYMGVAVFVKQMGTYLAKRHGLGDRHGSIMEHWPPSLRVREFPKTHQAKEVTNA